MRLRTLRDLDLQEQRVLLRVDFNVPLQGTAIVDDSRIVAAIPTLRWLLEARAAVVIATHLGRPNGQVVDALRVAPVARLADRLGLPVPVAGGVSGEGVVTRAHSLQPGELLMLENVRFDPREEANDPAFAQELADLAQVYVNDAFGTAHRAHASTEGVATSCRRPPACCWSGSMSFSRGSWVAPTRRWWRLSAAPRSRPRSA